MAAAGAGTTNREEFLANGRVVSDRLLSEGMGPVAADYARMDHRLQLLRKDPRGWEEFPPAADRSFSCGVGADLPGLLDEAADHLRPGGKAEGAAGPYADNDWRTKTSPASSRPSS